MTAQEFKVAYFSMEIGLNSRIPTYSGGLGILAGDFLKSAADIEYPMVGITLLNKHGYFFQEIKDNQQVEVPVSWSIDDFLEPVEETVEMLINGEKVIVGCWKTNIQGISGYEIPIYFLHTDYIENSSKGKSITDHLYGEGEQYRFEQEMVLGIGGVRMLSKLGYTNLEKYHMNEGHSALLSLELLRNSQNLLDVKNKCVFTTHTPVPAGHDVFDLKFVEKILEPDIFNLLPKKYHENKVLNMTILAMDHSNFINAVAKKHQEVSKQMFPKYEINSITNGVHANTWVSSHFSNLYNKYIQNWENDPALLRGMTSVNNDALWQAHFEAKKQIIDFVNANTNSGMDYDYFTIGWARRFTTYKRPEFLLQDIEKLKEISNKLGPIQIIYAGKAHPMDYEAKKLITKIINLSDTLNDNVKMVYLKNYDMYVSKFLTSGVDIWLNTPQPPQEASGTSGMKCAINGVPQISVLDGWWVEGCVNGETGWSFETNEELYNLLENKIINVFYNERNKWMDIMKKTIALNGSFFNSKRMITEYINYAYNRE